MNLFKPMKVAGALLFVLLPSVLFSLMITHTDAALTSAFAVHPPAPAPAPPAPPPPAPIRVGDAKECEGVCKGRCAVHSRPNVCNRACVACCTKCRCVPPGTYGNRDLCGACYTQWLTHGNRPKCP